MANRYPTDLFDLLGGLTGPPDPPGTRNAAPAGPRNGAEIAVVDEARQPQTTYSPTPAVRQGFDLDDLLGGPVARGINLAGLEVARQWVAWKEAANEKGDLTKTPFAPATGGRAQSNNATTWAPRRKAEARAVTMGVPGQVGLMLGRLVTDDAISIGGLDLDSCVMLGEVADWAQAVVDRFASYAEISPSGQGIKVFFTYASADKAAVQARMGEAKHRKVLASGGRHEELALDLSNRFYTVTGDRLDGAPADLSPVGVDAFAWLFDVAGPMAARAFGKPEKADAKRDRSREAFRLACEFARSGQSREAWVNALKATPDLADWAADPRQLSRAWDKASQNLDGFALTEDGVALAFTTRFRDELRFCHDTGRWFRWSGHHWAKENTQLAFDWVRATCREMAESDPLSPAAKVLSRANTASSVEKFARADRAHAATADDWDRHQWLLGTPGGTVDLRTGKILPADPANMITRLTAATPVALDTFDPGRDCPRWMAFLDQVLASDREAIRFLQQWAGYSLTGDTREEALLFVHGPGGSGKSTAINAIGDAMGDYCVNVAAETLSASKFDRHPTEIARLKGARMARASETEEGRAWAQQRITAMTGGDVMTARFMRKDDFEFRPEFKLTIVGNHAPAIQNVDGAIRRRFNVLPFDYQPSRADHGLKAALEAERAGILSWALQGCLDWQAAGLIRPRVVIDTTDAYLDAQDSFSLWLEESCVVAQGEASRTEDLWDSWYGFARRAGEDPGSKTKTFPERLKQAGFEPVRDTAGIRGRGFKGVRVVESEFSL